MAKFKSFKEIKITGVSDAKAIRLAVKQFEDSAKKRAKFTSNELRKVLETLPVNYMKLVEEEKIYLINMIDLEILKAKQRVKDSTKEDATTASAGGLKSGAQSSLQALESKKDSFLKEDTRNWGYLEDLRNIFNKDANRLQLSNADISVATLKMKIIENNWKLSSKDGVLDKNGRKQLDYIKKARVLLAKIDKLDVTELNKLGYGFKKGPTLKEIPELIKLSEMDMSINVKLAKETYISLTTGRGKISVELEPKAINAYKGTLSGIVVSMVDQVLTDKFKTKELLDSFDIQHVGFSPSFVEDVETMLTTAILGKKGRNNIKRKNVSKTEFKVARSAKLRAAKGRVNSKKIPKLPTIKQIDAGADLPLFSIMTLINEALAEQIKDNMGDSNDPPILLRNQTGRFAESARILTLTRAKAGVLLGTYTYQRSPYDVFLPGNKLGTTKRNPKVYIEGSIRELAIAIMKRKFPGLSLELS
jgi:hypothetical protein